MECSKGDIVCKAWASEGRPSQNIEAADGFPVFFQQVLQYIPKTATKASCSNDRDDKKTRNTRDVLPEVAPSPAGCQRMQGLHSQCYLLFRPCLSLSQRYGPEFWDELSRLTGLRRKKAPHVLLLPALTRRGFPPHAVQNNNTLCGHERPNRNKESTSTALTASREEKPSTHTHSRRSNILTNNNRSHALLATHNERSTQPAKPRKQTRPIKPPNPRLDFPESAPASPEEKSGFFDPQDQGTSPLTCKRICKVLFNNNTRTRDDRSPTSPSKTQRGTGEFFAATAAHTNHSRGD